MKEVIRCIRSILNIFPRCICSSTRNGNMFSVYTKKKIIKNKYYVIIVHHKESLTELVQETETYERAIRVAKKICEDQKDAL